MYNGKDCSGFLLRFPLDNLFQPFSMGVRIISALRNSYPDLFNKANLNPRGVEMFNKAAGNVKLLEAIIDGAPENELMRIAHKGLQEFMLIREKYLLYE